MRKYEMQVKGHILIILLFMLLFASVVVLQLNENHYLARLMLMHLTHLSGSRKTLSQAVTFLPVENQNCYLESNTKNALEDFWQIRQSLCQISVDGTAVQYAFREYVAPEKIIYQQVTLRASAGTEFEWLRIVRLKDSSMIQSWTYHIP